MNNDEVNALKFELAELKSQFESRVSNLEHKLEQVGKEESAVPNIAIDAASIPEPTVAVIPKKSPTDKIQPQPVAHAKLVFAPSFIEILFKAFMSTLFDWFKPVATIYQSYKTRGMLGIFVLTILGIGLTLAGFGYLMQLLIDQIGAGAKSLLLLGAALSIMLLGIVIKKKTTLGEFAAAIVSLGILLLYSTVYFAGSVYQVIPLLAVVVLYLLIALSSHVIALWLDTKIVAALGIVGVAIMPMLSDTIVLMPQYYLVSLALVTLSSLVIAYRYLGGWLANLSLAFVLLALEWIINLPDSAMSALIIDVFYLIFFGYVCLSLIFKHDVHKQTLIFLAALVGAHLLFFFQATLLSSHSVSIAFGINALGAVIMGVIFLKTKHALTHIMILIASIWTVLAIVSAVDKGIWSIAWAIEGVLLLYIGRRYLMFNVINQGQLLCSISILYGLAAILPYFPSPALLNIDGWILAISLALTVGIWLRLLDQVSTRIHQTIKSFLLLAESSWAAVILLGCSMVLLEAWTAVVALGVQIALLLRARMCGERNIEILAISLIFIPVFYVVNHVVNTQLYHFSSLPLFGKCAVISVLAQLWLFAEYYRRYQPNSALKRFAEAARIAFYLIIPVCWLGSAERRLDENILVIMWLSPMLALLFAYKIKHRLIIWQAKILTGLSSAILILGIMFLSPVFASVTLVLYMFCYAYAYLINARSAHELMQYVSSWGLLTLWFAIPMWAGLITDSSLVAFGVAALYWSGLMLVTQQWMLAQRNSMFVTLMNLVLLAISWVMMSDDSAMFIIAMIYVTAALFQKEQRFMQSSMGGYLKENSDLYLHAITAISYVVLLVSLTSIRVDLLIAPALAVHGAIILFMKDRRLMTVRFSFGLILLGIAKLGLVDAAHAVLWQKVMLFMGIGIFILGATFWYQRLVSVVEPTTNENEI